MPATSGLTRPPLTLIVNPRDLDPAVRRLREHGRPAAYTHAGRMLCADCAHRSQDEGEYVPVHGQPLRGARCAGCGDYPSVTA